MRKTLIIAAALAAIGGAATAGEKTWTKTPCRSVTDKYGTDVPTGAGEALAKSAYANKFGSNCNMYSFVAAECRLAPGSSVGAAVKNLLRKVASNKLPDIPMCGV